MCESLVTQLSERIGSLDSDTESGDFEIREPGGDSSSGPTWGGEIESWKPIGRGLQDFDIQDPEDNVPSHSAVAEEIDAWVEVSREKTRQTLAYWIMRLCTAWVLIGFIVFLVLGNVWFLTSLGVLAIPLKKVCDYYFCRSKYSAILKRGRIHLSRKDVRSKREKC